MFFWSKEKKEENSANVLNNVYLKLKEIYKEDDISAERKEYLSKIVKENGYLPYPYFKALEELTDAETLFALKEKWSQNNVFDENGFVFDNASVLYRNKITHSDWLKKEGHNIKLINLAGLGNRDNEAGKFIDWLKQLLILPTGNLENNIFNTTIYLIPFHPREFGCAYLPKSSEVSEALEDKELKEATGLDAKDQVKLFIQLAQLAGHPVIYDILPQTARFSKAVLANPTIARWYNIPELQKEILNKMETIELDDCDAEDLSVIKDIYKQGNTAGDLSEYYKALYDKFEEKMIGHKKLASEKMLSKAKQTQIHKKVKTIISNILGTNPNKQLTENDITKQLEIIQELIKDGFWSAPGGAWCSAGVPVFDRMSDCGSYPVFKHFDYKGEDVSHFANLDCQTPYYFAYLENGTYNEPVIDYFVNYMLDLQKEYNFDGFRVDHIDHIADKVSEQNGKPISYRAPKFVLNKLNRALKSKIPYFATLAEYMLWDNLYKEYHQEKGIHTALDTSGILFNKDNTQKVDELLKYTSLVMLDIKHINDEEHKKLTACSNKNILDFAKYLSEKNIPTWIRHVVVPKITYNEKYLKQLGEFLAQLKNIKALDVLPYHDMAVSKYESLGLEYKLKNIPQLTHDEAKNARDIILNAIKKTRNKQ